MTGQGAFPLPGEEGLVDVDPAPLTGAQRAGEACVGCEKRWPRPRVPVGRLPDGRLVRRCPECAPLVTS